MFTFYGQQLLITIANFKFHWQTVQMFTKVFPDSFTIEKKRSAKIKGSKCTLKWMNVRIQKYFTVSKRCYKFIREIFFCQAKLLSKMASKSHMKTHMKRSTIQRSASHKASTPYKGNTVDIHEVREVMKRHNLKKLDKDTVKKVASELKFPLTTYRQEQHLRGKMLSIVKNWNKS